VQGKNSGIKGLSSIDGIRLEKRGEGNDDVTFGSQRGSNTFGSLIAFLFRGGGKWELVMQGEVSPASGRGLGGKNVHWNWDIPHQTGLPKVARRI